MTNGREHSAFHEDISMAEGTGALVIVWGIAVPESKAHCMGHCHAYTTVPRQELGTWPRYRGGINVGKGGVNVVKRGVNLSLAFLIGILHIDFEVVHHTLWGYEGPSLVSGALGQGRV